MQQRGCARHLLVAGAAEPAGAVSPGAADEAFDGELAGALSPPHAASTPTVAITARSARSAMFFMILFLRGV
jgi:hypothetical protein